MTIPTSRASVRPAEAGSHLALCRAAALLTVVIWGWSAPPPASAQLLGSLIVNVSEPAPGSTVGGTTVVTARVTVVGLLTVRGVQFTLDGVALGAEDTTAPYAVSWNTRTASNGTHTLRAVGRDLLGAHWTSPPVTVTVFNDTTPPTVGIVSPTAGATLSSAVTVRANASDNTEVVGVQFRLDGANLDVEDTTAPYSMSWNTTTASNGPHSLTAVARDAAGNSTTSSAVAVTVDNAPPAINITNPTAGAKLSGAVNVSANASDNIGVAGVQFRLDGVALGAEDTSAPYAVPWDTRTATNGSHTLTAVARDAAGHSTLSAPVAVTVDNASLVVSITAPMAGAMLSGAVTVSANASGSAGVAGVQFRLDGVALGAEDTTAPYAIPWDTSTASNGSHTLTAVAREAGGQSTSSAPVVVTVDNVLPAVTITAPLAGTTVSGAVTVSANASDNVGIAGVRFFAGGVQIGAEDTTSPYSVAWNTTTLADGAHTLTAMARDAAANTATSSAVSVTVSNNATPSASATRFENTDLAIAYTPGTSGPPAWFHGSRSRDWSNGTASFNRSANARATFRFTGTEVSWIGFRAFWAGMARVYVDDVFRADVDLFLPMCTPEQQAQGCVHEEDQVAVFTATNLALGAHTLTIEVTGGRNPAATDNAVVVDAFDVVRSSPLTLEGTRAEETASSFTAGWTQGDTTAAWSGGTAARSATAGAQAAVTLTGTEVRWIGLRGPDTGIARIFLDGSFHAQVDTYSTTRVVGVVFMATGLAAGRHVLTVEVTGSRNAAATGHAIFVDAFDVRSRVEERAQSISYAGTWQQEHMDYAWSGTTPNAGSGTAALSQTAGATATFTFTGTAVSWIGFRGPLAGIANVYVDDVLVAQPDLYAPDDQLRVPVFTSANLAPGSHTLRIEVTGQRNGAAMAALVIVDAFDVTLPSPAPLVSRVEQTAPSVAFTPDTGWSQSSPNSLFSGQTVALSTAPGARAELTFTGTSVRWIGQHRRDSGIARVYLDGAFIVQVDSFTLIQDEFQAAMFTATGLAPGQHVLTIEVTGEKHPSSSGSMVIVDAFEVY